MFEDTDDLDIIKIYVLHQQNEKMKKKYNNLLNACLEYRPKRRGRLFVTLR